MSESVTVMLDRSRAKRYFQLLACASFGGAWVLWFVLGFMGSASSPDGVTLQSVIRTTMYALPIGLALSLVFPGMMRLERKKKWVADNTGITVYDTDERVVTVAWDELDDMIFREYSVGIYLANRSPAEYNLMLPGEEECQALAELYNRSKGTFCKMDK